MVKRDAPADIDPASTTKLGSAHTNEDMNIVWKISNPLSRANPAKPINAVINIKAGIDTTANAPRTNHTTVFS